MVVRRRVCITEDQEKWLNDNHIELSPIVQEEIDQRMSINPGQAHKATRNVGVFFIVAVLGFVAFMFALLAPPVAGADPIVSMVLAILGGVTATYGIIQMTRWGG